MYVPPQEAPLSRVDRRFLPVIACYLFCLEITLLHPPTIVLDCHRLVRCSRVSRNQCTSIHP